MYGTLIGKGSFSKVYRSGTSRHVTVVSEDLVKECMAMGWFPSSRLFPKIKRISWGVYRMKYYPKVRSPKRQLNPKSYELYRMLREAYIKYNWYDGIPTKYERILNEAVDALRNYADDICFEISPRNISCTPKGNLVLLDCFFFRSKL